MAVGDPQAAARETGHTSTRTGDLLTVAEVAAMCRVSKMTIYRLIHAGELAAVRVGRSLRIPAGAAHNLTHSA